MVTVALVLDVAFVVVAVGVRTAVQRRRTGDTGWRLGRPHSVAEALARGGFVVSVVALVLALVRSGSEPPAALAVGAIAVAMGAIVLVVVAQVQMGSSWRIGVDPEERTTLIRSGIYTNVRNPIYTGMAAFVAAHAVLTPSGWALASTAAMIIGVQLQVRLVEEPYLRRLHGDEFGSWAESSGRFLPGLG